MGQFTIGKNQQVVQGIPIGRLNDIDNRVKVLEGAGPGGGMTNPMTTLGDVIYGAASGTPTRLAGNTATIPKYLVQVGDGVNSAAPTWSELPLAGQLTYMFSTTNSDIGGYESMPSLATYTVSALGTITTVGVSTTPTLLASFATNVGFPNITSIPVGLFHAHYETEKVAGSNNYYTYFEIYKRTSGGTETLVATSDNSSQFAVNTVIQHILTASLTSAVILNSTDRIVIKIYGVMLSSTATIHLYYDDTTDARMEMPSAVVDATNFVPYTGATLDVNLGTKNITANNFSGTSTGTNTGDQLMYGTISVAGQSDLDPTGTGDTLTFAEGANITLTTNAGTNTLTIASTGGGVSDGDKGDITVSASGATWTIDDGAVTLAKQANMATDSVVYRKTAGAGAPEVQTLATLKTDLGLTGTNSGDNAVNTLYSGLVSNATHTGDATGATALTVVKIQGKDFPTLGAGDDQKYPKYNNGTNAFVMTAIAGGGDVTGDDTSTTTQNIVAYSDTGGKNITELTGTQGDILYHNGTNWAKLGAGTVGQYLETNGSGANPSWSYGAMIHSSKSAGVTTTGANVTPVSVSGAVFDYVASAVYRIWVMGRINSTAATTGGAIQFDLSSAVTAINVIGGNLLASTGTATFFAGVADDTTLGTGSSGVPSGPVDVPIFAHALLVTGANTGTCQLRFRSETTAVTELLAGVVMIVERVA